MSPWFYNHSIPSKILSCLAPKISESSQDLTVLALMWKSQQYQEFPSKHKYGEFDEIDEIDKYDNYKLKIKQSHQRGRFLWILLSNMILST